MRTLIMWNVITLDGCFEGPKSWDLGFHESVWGPELEQFSLEQLRSADYLIFGRVTYQGMADYWQAATGEVADFMNRLPKVVFSRTLAAAAWRNTRLIKTDVVQEIKRLKEEGAGIMYVFGSANLSTTIIKNNLFDEYRLVIAPAVLGSGKPLFKPGSVQLQLRLLEAKPLETGGVILRYKPQAKS